MTGAGFYVTRGGLPVSGRVHGSDYGVIGELHRVQSSSAFHAVRWEGYAVETTTADTWPDDKRRELARTARYLFRDHGHDMTFDDADEEEMTRDSCGACALAGHGATDDGPNYAGWARVYVEAGRRIPAEWADGFLRELASDNEAYAAALARDIRTFGVAGVTVPRAVLS